MKYNIIFNLHQIVKIKQLELHGRILGIYIEDNNTVTYKVRYFDHAEARSEFFYEDELK
jgi:arginyl-tRNA--protein-N-Asp/Glu arginylyltransferase